MAEVGVQTDEYKRGLSVKNEHSLPTSVGVLDNVVDIWPKSLAELSGSGRGNVHRVSMQVSRSMFES